MGSTEPTTEVSAEGKQAVSAVAGRVSRRTQGALVRNSFVRAQSPSNPAPLATLATTKGRGAAVPLKLYLAILWLAATHPYDTNLPAASWARVLDLDAADTQGARRIRDALDRLKKLKLIKATPTRGSANQVTLLREDGSGEPYKIPYASITTHGGSVGKDGYFKIPPQLWTSGHMQNMSAAALTMLLIILEESRGKQQEQWWSGQVFEDRFAISKDVRARGTAELLARGLIRVERRSLARSPGMEIISDRRSRKAYELAGEAAANMKT